MNKRLAEESNKKSFKGEISRRLLELEFEKTSLKKIKMCKVCCQKNTAYNIKACQLIV